MISSDAKVRDDKLRTMVQVARLYYERDMSQQAIASELGVSRSLIAKYLMQSKQRGIVRIEIVDPSGSNSELAAALRERFGLAHVEVLANAHASPALTLQGVSHAAGSWFMANVKTGQKIGLGWGRSLKSMVEQLQVADFDAEELEVIPLLGESSNPRLHSRMNELVEQLAGTLGARSRFLFYPMTVDSKALYKRIVEEPTLVDTNQAWDQLDWAFVGLGATPLTEGMAVYVSEKYLPALQRSHAVGDICCRYFDEAGEFVKTPFDEQIIGIKTTQLQRATNVVAIAAGREKARALRGALRTGLVSALFVDQMLAEAVLEESGAKKSKK